LPNFGVSDPIQNLPGANSPLSGSSSPFSFGQQVQQPNIFRSTDFQQGLTSNPTLSLLKSGWSQPLININSHNPFNNINQNQNPLINIFNQGHKPFNHN
jgi:hypothetical protein